MASDFIPSLVVPGSTGLMESLPQSWFDGWAGFSVSRFMQRVSRRIGTALVCDRPLHAVCFVCWLVLVV